MSLPRFTFTDRAAPFVEVGVGDTRTDVGVARWDVAHWNNPADATWSGAEPLWVDETCHGYTMEIALGRQRNTDTFAPATVTITLDNATGWADATLLTLRPGRSIRAGVDHVTLGRVHLFYGIVDAVTQHYTPDQGDTVEISAICVLGEVGRVELPEVADPGVGAGESATARVNRILDKAKWPATKRQVVASGTACVATRFGQAVADMFAVVAESVGGSIYGDTEGRVAFRGRDWQMYLPTDPVNGTIGNVGAGDVCPSDWQLSHRRDDMVTQAILGRDGIDDEPWIFDDADGQEMYGFEVFDATDLICEAQAQLATIAGRLFRVRGGSTSTQRVEQVQIDAATADNAVDLATRVSVFDQPSRYRCRLQLARGVVFDAEMFAAGVRHIMTPESWNCEIDLDNAAPFQTEAARWDDNNGWDLTTWAGAQLTREAA